MEIAEKIVQLTDIAAQAEAGAHLKGRLDLGRASKAEQRQSVQNFDQGRLAKFPRRVPSSRCCQDTSKLSHGYKGPRAFQDTKSGLSKDS